VPQWLLTLLFQLEQLAQMWLRQEAAVCCPFDRLHQDFPHRHPSVMYENETAFCPFLPYDNH
jgi:hypothetical protein